MVGARPHVDNGFVASGVERVDLSASELERAAAVVVLVDHDDFDLDLVGANGSYVLDTRRCLKGPNVEYL